MKGGIMNLNSDLPKSSWSGPLPENAKQETKKKSASESEKVKEKSNRAAIHVICEAYADGKGDFSFALKTVEVLKRNFSDDVDVILHPFGDFEEKTLHNWPGGTPSFESMEKLKEKCETQPSLVIHAPVILHKLPVENSSSTNIWHLNEYSMHGGMPGGATHENYKAEIEGDIFTSGVGKDEWGIFLDKHLNEKMKNLELEGKNCDPQQIQQILDETLKEFLLKNTSSQYYMAYTKLTVPALYYCRTVFENQKNNDNNFDVCLLGLNPAMAIEDLSPFFEGAGKKYNIKNLEIWTKEKATVDTPETFRKMIDYESNAPDGKTVRLIFPGGVSHHDDFIKLLIASQPFVLMTGDQSFSEAISARKIALYDMPDGHKRFFMQNMGALAASLDNPSAAVMLKMLSGSSDIILKNPNPLANPNLHDSFRKLSEVIFEKYDLEQTLIKNVGEWLHKADSNKKI